jgi:hypothetical protein
MMPADDATRIAVKRRSDAVSDRAVLPLECGVQVGASQRQLQLTAAAVTESVIEWMKVVAEPDRLASQIGWAGQVIGPHVGPDNAPVGAPRCRPQW